MQILCQKVPRKSFAKGSAMSQSFFLVLEGSRNCIYDYLILSSMIKVILLLDGAKAKKGIAFSLLPLRPRSASGVLRGDIFRGLTLNSCKRLKLTTYSKFPTNCMWILCSLSQMSIQIGLFRLEIRFKIKQSKKYQKMSHFEIEKTKSRSRNREVKIEH